MTLASDRSAKRKSVIRLILCSRNRETEIDIRPTPTIFSVGGPACSQFNEGVRSMYQTVNTRPLAAALSIAFLVVGAPAAPAGSQASSSDRVSTLNITILSTMLADEGLRRVGLCRARRGRRPADSVRHRRQRGHGAAQSESAEAGSRERRNGGAEPQPRRPHHRTDAAAPAFAAANRQGAVARSMRVAASFWPRIDATARSTNGWPRSDANTKPPAARHRSERADAVQPGVWLTGPVPRVHPERNWSGLGRVRLAYGDVEDTVAEDMALVVQTKQGLVSSSAAATPVSSTRSSTCARPSIRRASKRSSAACICLPPTTRILPGRRRSSNASACSNCRCALHRRRSGVSDPRARGLTRQTCMVGAVGATYSLDKGINPLRVAK